MLSPEEAEAGVLDKAMRAARRVAKTVSRLPVKKVTIPSYMKVAGEDIEAFARTVSTTSERKDLFRHIMGIGRRYGLDAKNIGYFTKKFWGKSLKAMSAEELEGLKQLMLNEYALTSLFGMSPLEKRTYIDVIKHFYSTPTGAKTVERVLAKKFAKGADVGQFTTYEMKELVDSIFNMHERRLVGAIMSPQRTLWRLAPRHGKALAKLFREWFRQTQLVTGEMLDEVQRALELLTPDEYAVFPDMMRGRVVPTTPNAQEAVKRVRAVLDSVAEQRTATGDPVISLLRGDPKKGFKVPFQKIDNYWPTVCYWDDFSSGEFRRTIIEQLANKRGTSLAEAEQFYNTAIREARKIYAGNLDFARDIGIEGTITDPL